MKKLLPKNFSACLPLRMAFIVTAMMYSESANAQIIYTDVIPDVSLTCTVSAPNSSSSAEDSIDINNDGVFDLKLSLGASRYDTLQTETRSGFVKATPLNGSSINSDISGYPLHLYRNDSIKSNSHWVTTSNQILETESYTSNQVGTTKTGNWTPPIDGFLGIKVVSASQTYFGWVRLNVSLSVYNPTTASCTYKEFAYDSIPNQPILAGQASANVIIAPFVNIPDAAFKSVLINNAGINTDIDREIQVTEASAFTRPLEIYGATITNLTGLEAFTAIDSLYFYYTQLTSLDVTANTALVYLNCDGNQFTSIEVSGNTALKELYCTGNQLASLNLSGNAALTELDCDGNQLTSLDVSTNTALRLLWCSGNQLTSLNAKNGNNANFLSFDATSNPNLTCIQVDNVAYSNANWSAYKDAATSFSTNCGVTYIPDFDELANFQIIPNPATNNVTINLGTDTRNVEVTIADITGKIIYKTTATDVQKLEVNTTDFAKGIYVVQIQSADYIATKKLVVEK